MISPDPAAEVLSLVDVRKTYGSLVALDSVTLRIGRGSFVGLLGPNGAGKSTLFQIVSGLFRPDAGEVRLFGLRYATAASGILRRIGVVFQGRSLDLDMSVGANLRFHGGLFGLAGRVLRQRIDELSAELDIEDHLRRPVRTLSGGEQRRIEIARALLNRPEFLLMDEPSAGLDAAARQALVRNVTALVRDHGMTVLWATHLVDEIGAADRVVLLSRGRIVEEGPPADVVARAGTADLTQAYIALTDVQTTAEFGRDAD